MTSWLCRRTSAIVVLVLAVMCIVFIIPRNTQSGFLGTLVQPDTLPMFAAMAIALGALLALFEPTATDDPHLPTMSRASLFVGLLVLAVVLSGLIGFKWAAPLLGLAVMLAAYERRWLWLAAGAGAMPLAIWVLFEIVLGRPLP